MGQIHFETMYQAAARRDARALIWATVRQVEAAREGFAARGREATSVPPFWEAMPFHRIMDLSRRILDIDDQFTGVLKEMIAAGEIKLRIPGRGGKMYDVRDPDMLTLDEPRFATTLAFNWALVNFP